MQNIKLHNLTPAFLTKRLVNAKGQEYFIFFKKTGRDVDPIFDVHTIPEDDVIDIGQGIPEFLRSQQQEEYDRLEDLYVESDGAWYWARCKSTEDPGGWTWFFFEELSIIQG